VNLLKRITFRHWAWIHVMLAFTAWAVLLQLYTPVGVYAALQEPLVTLWTTTAAVGGIIAILGLVLSLVAHARTRVISVSVELFGLCLALVGPFTYTVTQASLIAADGLETRLALTMLAYFSLSVILYRIFIVIPRFRKEAVDARKDV